MDLINPNAKALMANPCSSHYKIPPLPVICNGYAPVRPLPVDDGILDSDDLGKEAVLGRPSGYMYLKALFDGAVTLDPFGPTFDVVHRSRGPDT
jgi:hypothetical protein